MSEETLVTTKPDCDFCGAEASFDGKTILGPWAYMCDAHWKSHGLGQLGTGRGQRLVLKAK